MRGVSAHFTADCEFTCAKKGLRSVFPHFTVVFYLCGRGTEECISTLHCCILPVRKRDCGMYFHASLLYFTCVEKGLRSVFPHFTAVFYLCGKGAEEGPDGRRPPVLARHQRELVLVKRLREGEGLHP